MPDLSAVVLRSPAGGTRPAGEPAGPRSWPRWPFDLILAVLFFGPLLSPLLRASGLPLLNETGVLARDVLSAYICPTPVQSYGLLGYPMAVCARCWGATIGLWLARMLLPATLSPTRPALLAPLAGALARLRAWAWPWRLLICGLPFVLWPLEIVGTAAGWWMPPLWLLVVNGAQAGLAAGFFFLSVWPGFWPHPTAAPAMLPPTDRSNHSNVKGNRFA